MNLDILLTKIINKGETALDIGAHEGIVTYLLAELVGDSGKVSAFEPNPKKFKILSSKNRLPNVVLEPSAVGDQQGSIPLYFGEEEFADQASTIMNSLATKERLGDKINSVQVPITTLDDYCEKNRLTPSAVKIDVEGAELLVFKGSTNLINKTRPIFIFEQGFHNEALEPQTIQLLKNSNYFIAISELHYFKNIKNGWKENNVKNSLLPPLHDQLIEYEFDYLKKGVFHTNLIAIPNEKWSQLKTKLTLLNWQFSFSNLKHPIAHTPKFDINFPDSLKTLGRLLIPHQLRPKIKSLIEKAL